MSARASARELRASDDCLRRFQCGTEVATWLFAIAILVTACVWPPPARGAILNDMSLGDDAWSTTLTQSSDGTISIVGGHDSTWVTRVDGLESIRRLPESEVAIVEPPAQWLEGYTAGGFRRKLTIENTSRSHRSLTDVPILVKLTPERFDFANSTPAGTDIRFTAADGVTLLDFERVRHDAEAGEASYWVRVPRIWPHGVNCYVYYRPTPNADLADGAKMWAAKSYRAVLHMDETEGDRLIDATSHERHLAGGNRPLNAEGKVGAGIGPGTTGDRTDGMLDGSFTLSMWIRPTAYKTTLAAADIPGASATYAFSLTPDGTLKTWVHNSHSIEEMIGTTVVPLNEWTHVAHGYGAGRGQQTLYVNGVPETSRRASRVWNGGGRVSFGAFSGMTDEVRLAEGALTAQRIKTEYLSERDGLVRYGDREAFPAAPARRSPDSMDRVRDDVARFVRDELRQIMDDVPGPPPSCRGSARPESRRPSAGGRYHEKISIAGGERRFGELPPDVRPLPTRLTSLSAAGRPFPNRH